VRICILYDCLFPHTVGGAERWLRALAERLADEGHEVTYVTRRQWSRRVAPNAPRGVRVVVVAPRIGLYTRSGRRRIVTPLLYGAGVLWHLLRHGHRYDVVHTASFPYFSLLAAAVARRRGHYRLVVDWYEVWSRGYWETYLGRRGGAIGHAVQARCARVEQHAFCFSRLYAARLHEEGLRGEVTVLEGLSDGPHEPAAPKQPEPVLLFAGRLIPEKQAAAIVPALALLREEHPELRLVVCGDGPERERLTAAVAAHRQTAAVELRGFVPAQDVHDALARAACLVHPSSREGYGLVVVEAARVSTPVVLVDGPDNAAVELVEDGVNGLIAPTPSPSDLAAAIRSVLDAGLGMRTSTRAWFATNAPRLSLESSLERVLAVYAGTDAPSARP
jgi:glycosyltransferase involved in cell wall biosynthesis